MSALSLVRLAVDPRALAAFAVTHRASDADYGYALHLALRRRFGAAAPQPFRYFANGRTPPHLLGYAASAELLGDAAALASLEEAADVFPHPPECRAMPEVWRPGARYAFEVRVRPVVRYGGRVRAAREARGDALQSRAREVDAYLAACERADGAPVDREIVYREWLARRLDGAAGIERAEMRLMRRIRTSRSAHGKGRRQVESSEALFAGVLAVLDSAKFVRLLCGGVGRHTAFGFGLLTLAPPGPG